VLARLPALALEPLHQPCFCFLSRDRVSLTVSLGWFPTLILLTSASSMNSMGQYGSHQRPQILWTEATAMGAWQGLFILVSALENDRRPGSRLCSSHLCDFSPVFLPTPTLHHSFLTKNYPGEPMASSQQPAEGFCLSWRHSHSAQGSFLQLPLP
jgi:hypothetical protein